LTEQRDPLTPRSYRVAQVTPELPDCVTLHLEPDDPTDTAVCSAGQFNMLYALGVGEVPISLSGRDEKDRLMHTIRAVGSVTNRLAALRPGSRLGLRGPFGDAWNVESYDGEDLLIVAGGLGIAPLRPLVTEVLRQRERFGRVAILYGARHPSSILFREDLQRWRGRFDLTVEVTVDMSDRKWRGEVGVVTRLIERAAFEPDETVAFVCGPETMMRFAARELVDEGVAPAHVLVSLERNMRCAVGLCGHCQYGAEFICRDGPILSFDRVAPLLEVPEL
jgi:NAD(P)H-flavin reductase